MTEPDSISLEFRRIVCEVLVLEPDELELDTPWGQLSGDGSLDLLDLSFQCEKHFGIRLRFQDLAVSGADLLLDDQSRLTPEGVSRIVEQLPFLDPVELQSRQLLYGVADLFTVNSLERLLRAKLEASVSS